ncbi:MAG: 3-isopropylmalate dehydratase small subunit [Brevinema sp.]
MKVQGPVWKYGDNIDTDVIIPARYLMTTDEKELASHCMEDLDTSFAKNVTENSFVVAGDNFGCGSSREHAPVAIKACGVKVVIAKSFARIFFRNAINIGLVILEHPTFTDEINSKDVIEVDTETGTIKNITTGKEYFTTPYQGKIDELIQAGGLVNFTKEKLGTK